MSENIFGMREHYNNANRMETVDTDRKVVMKKVFLSYGHKEHAIVKLIRDHLISDGFDV